MSEKYPMTPAGHAAMKAQLYKLKNVDRIEDYGEASTMPLFGGTLS